MALFRKEKPKAKVDNHLRVGKPKLDPLADVPDAGHVLFRHLSKVCNDFPMDAVVNGCSALLLNSLRQRNALSKDAEADFNELYGRMKSMLLTHYDGVTGKRKQIFPFHQLINVPFMDLRDKK